MPGAALLNGEPVAATAFNDRGLHFGDGLFETLAVIDGAPCVWERHFLRLQKGCERLGLPCPDRDELYGEACHLSSGRGRAVLKLIVTAGPVERGYARSENLTPSRWLQCSDWPQSALYNDGAPLRLQTCHTRLGSQPLLAGIKHLNRLEQVLARNEIRPPADEGVMRDQHGRVVEGISSNLLVRLDNRWVTPPIDDCGIAGVVRGMLLDAAQQESETVTETPIAPIQLRTAQAVYVMNSLLGIRAVGWLDDHRFPPCDDIRLIRRVHAACFTAGGLT